MTISVKEVLKLNVKEIKSLLSLNQQFSKNTVDLYKKEIESLRKEIKYWEKSIVAQ